MSEVGAPPPTRQLRVLSLNVWGLKWVSAHRAERLEAIARYLCSVARRCDSATAPDSVSSSSSIASTSSAGTPLARPGDTSKSDEVDLVCLQELWVHSDFERLRSALSHAFPHARYFRSGTIGSGLAIFSVADLALSDAFVQPFALCGEPLAVIEGDFYSGKAVAGACVRLPGTQATVCVLNTHLYAPGGEAEGIHGAHRLAQTWQLVRLVRERIRAGDHVVLAGDLNSQPDSLIMQLLRAHTPLQDAWTETQAPAPLLGSHVHLSLLQQAREAGTASGMRACMDAFGTTCDAPLNTFSAGKLKHKRSDDPVMLQGGKRLDYALFASPRERWRGDKAMQLQAAATQVVLVDERVSLGRGASCSYSDHFGLLATFSFGPAQSGGEAGEQATEEEDEERRDTLVRAFGILSRSRGTGARRDSLMLCVVLPSCVCALIICILAGGLAPPPALGALFSAISGLSGVAGATALYVGFVAGRTERAKLLEVLLELDEELDRLDRRAPRASASRSTTT